MGRNEANGVTSARPKGKKNPTIGIEKFFAEIVSDFFMNDSAYWELTLAADWNTIESNRLMSHESRRKL